MVMEELINQYEQYMKLRRFTECTLRTHLNSIRIFKDIPYLEWPNHFHKISLTIKEITANSYYRRLRVFCKWAIKEGHFEENITDKFITCKEPKTIPKSLTHEQARKLIRAAAAYSHRAHAIYYTFLHTGIRKKELLALEPHHIQYKEKLIYIFNGKGKKDRVIPMSDELELVLKRWEERRPNHEKFFCLSEVTLKRLKRKIQQDLDFHFSNHICRHTFGTLMIRNGADLLAVKDIMGHADIKTTMGYLSSSPEHMRAQIDKLSL